MGGEVSCMDLHGNGYALKRYVGEKVVAAEPLRPDMMSCRRNANGVRLYDYSGPRFRGTYTEKDILHLRGFTLGGDVGLSAVSFGRHSLGIALAADETAGKTFANGLQVSGFVKLPAGTKADKEQKKQLIDLFDKFTGSSRAGKVMPLDGGMEFSPLDMKPEDAQLLESRGFSVEEICRWFDTPPILIGHAGEGQTMWGSGIEQIMLAWLATGLDPLLVSIEQALEKQMLSPAERRRYYVEFTREGLLRADSKARAEFYNKVFGVGGISPNQIADRENLPRFDGGDGRYVNATYVPIEEAGRRRTQPAPGDPI
jgi:HK97 family phage portal protein